VLEVLNLTCERFDKTLLSEVSFSVSPGEVLHIQGPNGMGKSTLLQYLAGLLPYEEGSIAWQGTAITQDLEAFQQQVHWFGQMLGFNPHMTLRQNLTAYATLYGCDKSMLGKHCEVFDVGGFMDKPMQWLSHGQRQRGCLTRLLVHPAKLWLLDEPYTGLDTTWCAETTNLIETHVKAGGLAVVVSHQPLLFSDITCHQLSLTETEVLYEQMA